MKKCYELGYPEHCQFNLKPTLHFYFLFAIRKRFKPSFELYKYYQIVFFSKLFSSILTNLIRKNIFEKIISR
jgi:hypothetical protein